MHKSSLSSPASWSQTFYQSEVSEHFAKCCQVPEPCGFTQFSFMFINVTACLWQNVEMFIFRCRSPSTSRASLPALQSRSNLTSWMSPAMMALKSLSLRLFSCLSWTSSSDAVSTRLEATSPTSVLCVDSDSWCTRSPLEDEDVLELFLLMPPLPADICDRNNAGAGIVLSFWGFNVCN